ncbi:MAG TPA: DUF1707 domain-containing protein [Actinophytocola sp.]|nr:DUF1707 domain-containing protein [Actinophytocola sp.]
MGRDDMRAGDSDRQAVADKLKQALDEGRLDLGEYDERLQRTYAAKTYGDLNGLLDDLPGPAAAPQPGVAPVPLPPPAGAPVRTSRAGELVRSWLGGFGGVFVICVVVWLATSIGSGHALYFWPVWLLIPMAAGALEHFGRGDRHRHR